MQVLDRGIFLKLKALAKSRGVTVQELIRVLVIPDWMRKSQEEYRRTEERRRHRRLAGPARRPLPAFVKGPGGGAGRGGFLKFSAGGGKRARLLYSKLFSPFFFLCALRWSV